MRSTEQRLTEQSERHKPGSGAADLALVKRVQQGDRSAFDLLVIKYQHKILKLIMRYVRDPSEALDVAQEAFLKAYRAAPSFRGDSAFYTWLYRIAINTAKNHLVALGRRPQHFDLDTQDPEQSEVLADLRDLDTPEGLAQSEEIREAINRAIRGLPEELRTAILLREIEGMSYEEIAEVMNCPIGTVRSRIFRAREAISARVKPLLDNQSGKRW
jgi:RNA polymerase sigma-70 factor (ECF subfamily)